MGVEIVKSLFVVVCYILFCQQQMFAVSFRHFNKGRASCYRAIAIVTALVDSSSTGVSGVDFLKMVYYRLLIICVFLDLQGKSQQVSLKIEKYLHFPIIFFGKKSCSLLSSTMTAVLHNDCIDQRNHFY